MKISDKIDAEYINRKVFRLNEEIKKESFFYKCGLLILSGNGAETEKKIKHIDCISGIADRYVLKGEMKRALLYAALLKRKVNQLTEEVKKAEITLPSAD
ncbi:MAG: hypothetical protein ACI4KB_12780 [Oscillospiraceae bacterium]